MIISQSFQFLFIALLFVFATEMNAQRSKDLSQLTTPAIDSIITLLKLANQYEAALPYAEEIVQRTVNHPPDSSSTLALKNLGVLYYYLGDYQAALPLFKKTKEAYLAIYGTTHKDYLTALNNLATLYSDLGNYEEAESLFLENQKILLKTIGSVHEDYAQLLYNFARMYYHKTHYTAAESLFLQAKNIWAKTTGTSHSDYGACLNGLAALYLDLGRYDEAEHLYLEALEIQAKAPQGKKSTAYIMGLSNLAFLYKLIGNVEAAQKFYLEAIDINQQKYGDFHLNNLQSINHLADLYRSIQDFQQAEFFYKQAKEITKKNRGNAHPDYAFALENLAALYLDMTQYSDAEKLLLEALSIHQKYGEENPTNYLHTLNFLSKLYTHKKEYPQAKKHALAALSINAFNSDSSQILRPSSTNFFQHQNYHSLQQAFISLIQLHDYYSQQYLLEDNKNHLKQAYLITEGAMRLLNKIPPSALENSPAFSTNFAHRGILAAMALDKAENTKKHSLLAFRFIEQHKSICTAQIFQIQENSLYSLSSGQQIEALLDEKTALLEYFITDTVLYLLKIQHNQTTLHALPVSKNLLLNKINLFRNALGNYNFVTQHSAKAYNDYTQTAHWFWQHLLAPALTASSPIDQLLIITNGELAHLPFETFLMEAAPSGMANYSKLAYLINKYKVGYHYAAALWKHSYQQKKITTHHQLFAYAPSYNKHSEQLSERPLHLNTVRTSLPNTPAAKEEILALASLYKGEYFYDLNANETKFKENSSKSGILHLAMQRISNPALPMLSSLVFAEDNQTTEDNFLDAHEISTLRLQRDLVVLSIGESTYEKQHQQEGLFALIRSFMYAGAPSLLVNLWQNNHPPSSKILLNFYQNLVHNMSKTEALQAAKRTYISSNDGLHAHPIFWASLIQIGNDENILLETKSRFYSPQTWFFLSIFVLLLTFIIAKIRKRLL